MKKLKPVAPAPAFSPAGGMGVGYPAASTAAAAAPMAAAAAPMAAAASMMSSFPQAFTPASGGGAPPLAAALATTPYAQLPNALMYSAMTGQPMLHPSVQELAQHPLTEVFARVQSFSLIETMNYHTMVMQAVQNLNAVAESVS